MATKSKASAAQIAANKRNAQKSTGPKTQRGKEIARANSLKHGLTGAGLALPIEDANHVENLFRDLHAEMCPLTILGSIMVKNIALCSVRIDRSARHQVAYLKHKLRHAEANYDEAKKGDADHLLGWIGAEPVAYRRNLLSTPQGIDCLIKALTNLREDVVFEAHLWDVNQEMKLEAYFGRRSDDVPYSRGRRLSRAIQNDLSMLSPEEAEIATKMGTRAWSIEQMILYLDTEIKYLNVYKATFDHAKLAEDRAEAIERAAVDVGKESLLLKKYDAANKREFFRYLKEYRIVEATGDIAEEATDESPLCQASDKVDIPPLEPEPTPPSIDVKLNISKDLEPKLGSFENSTSATPSTLDQWTNGGDIEQLFASRRAKKRRRPRLE